MFCSIQLQHNTAWCILQYKTIRDRYGITSWFVPFHCTLFVLSRHTRDVLSCTLLDQYMCVLGFYTAFIVLNCITLFCNVSNRTMPYDFIRYVLTWHGIIHMYIYIRLYTSISWNVIVWQCLARYIIVQCISICCISLYFVILHCTV